MIVSKLRWLITLIVVVLVVLSIVRIVKSSKKWAKDLKDEFRITGTEALMNMLSPSDELDKKVKKRRKHRKSKLNHDHDTHPIENNLPPLTRTSKHPPRNSNNKTEERVRAILEDYFDDYFPTARPNFLRNPKTNRNLELDGYNARLNLAFEYQGKQHRVFPNYFHKTEKEFKDQKSRDKYKRIRLYDLGIKLLEVDDTIGNSQTRLEDFIHGWLKDNGFKRK